MNKIITLFSMMLFASIMSAQCDAEFDYGGTTEFCTTGGTATVSHMTGEDGTYTFTGTGTLDINIATGEIDLAGSDAGAYDVTNTVIMSGTPPQILITGVIDGPLTGGVPKAIEFYVLEDIADLSIYGFGSANNAGGSDGEEFTFPAIAATAGTYIQVASETDMFMSFFGFNPDYTSSAANINGDDSMELFCDGDVIDVYGVVGTDGTGEDWEYLDGWAYRNDASLCPSPTFDITEWTLSGTNALEGETSNATAATPFPIESYDGAGCPGGGGNGCTDAVTVSITISEGAAADAGGNQLGCGTNPISLNATGSGIWSGGNGSFDDPANPSTNYNPNAFEVGTTVTLTYTVIDQVCGNTSDDISVTIFEEAGDSEFFYAAAIVCPNADPIMAMHVTGENGTYTYEVLAGGPDLDLDAMSGMIDPSISDEGTYTVTNTLDGAGQMTLSGVADGTMTGGQPKAVELFALSDISDLGNYGIGIAPNGNASNGADFTFPAGDMASAGDHIYVTANGPAFLSFFGFEADYVSNAISINGDDVIELFENGNLIDAYGDVGVDGTGMPWEYTDGWALRNSNTGPDGGFNANNWSYGGVNSLEGGTNNDTANNPFPIGTFTSFQGPICPGSATSVMLTIGDNEAPVIDCPSDISIALEPGECGEVVILLTPSASDNCGDVTINQTAGPLDGDFVHLDDSPVTVSFDIIETNGTIYTCEYEIILIEYEPSSDALTCNNNVNISLDDNCEVLINADMILEGSNYGCYEDYIIETSFGSDLITVPGTYTVTVTDPETGNSCWSEILVEDKLSATLICSICPPGAAAAGALECIYSCVDEDAILAGLIAVPGPELTDNCGDANLTFTDEVADGNTCGSRVITRTYAVIASDGTIVSSCVSEYLLNAITTASLQFSFPPATVILPCGTDTDPEDVAAFFDDKIDTNGDGFPDSPTNPTNDIPTGPNCPVDVIEKHEGIAIGYVHYFETGCDGISYAQPIDNSVCMLNVTYSDQEIPDCGAACSGFVKVIRTWTVLDWCVPSAPPVTFIQVVKSSDTEAPTMEVSDITGSVNPWTCAGDLSLPAPTILHDACTANISYTISGPAGVTLLAPGTPGNTTNNYIAYGIPIGANTFTYTATDCCGNFTNVPVTVTIFDTTPPIPVATQNIIVNLTTDATGAGVAKIFTNAVDDGSHDSCSDVKIEIRRASISCGYSGNGTFNADGHPQDGSSNPNVTNFDPDNGEFVKFCCDDIDQIDPVTGVEFGIVQVMMRVFDDGNQTGFFGDFVDKNGDGDVLDAGEYDNYNETWVDVRVEGKAITSIVCPIDVTLNCDMDYTDPNNIGVATSLALCGASSASVSFTEQLDACGEGFVIATYMVDGSSPAITCSQRITMENQNDPFDPADIDYPRDLPTSPTGQLSCMDDIPFDAPTWTAGACDFIGYTEEVDTFFFEVDPTTGEQNDACFQILRTFTVIDWCVYDATDGAEGSYTGSQSIIITDNEAPILLDCEPAIFEVDENCVRESTTLTNIAEDNGDCASDWLKWQVFVDTWADGVVDYEYSSFVATNTNFNTDSNDNDIVDKYIAPTMSGEEVLIEVQEVIESSMFNHTVTWKVTDGCGNVASCETTFMVVDKKAPTPYCVALSTASIDGGDVELWAIDFDLGAFDNCTEQEDLRFTFSPTAPEDDINYSSDVRSSSMIFNMQEIIPVDVYVWDENGNVDFCTVNLTVIGGGDGGVGLRGTVKTEENIGVKEVTVKLEASLAEFPRTTNTNESGEYAFEGNPIGIDYSITASKEDFSTNGVSTLDLVLIQRHILGLQNLNSPYKIIAADINRDDNVSSIDIVELRKVVLGIQDEFQSNTSWRFIKAEQIFEDATSPFPVVEIRDVDDYQGDEGLQNFIAIKVGDVNATAAYNLVGESIDIRNGATMTLEVSDRAVVTGEQVEIAVSSSDFNDVSGLQMTVEFNGLIFNDIAGKAIAVGTSNVGVISDNVITMSWNSNTAITTADELFVITAVAAKDGNISEMIKISDKVITPEVYVGPSLEVQNVELGIRGIDGVVLANELMQNEPNPFKQSTAISFNLATAGAASLTIRDVAGKVIRIVKGEYAAGLNTISIQKSDINTVGVLYYTIESGDFSKTKKMIIIE